MCDSRFRASPLVPRPYDESSAFPCGSELGYRTLFLRGRQLKVSDVLASSPSREGPGRSRLSSFMGLQSYLRGSHQYTNMHDLCPKSYLYPATSSRSL